MSVPARSLPGPTPRIPARAPATRPRPASAPKPRAPQPRDLPARVRQRRRVHLAFSILAASVISLIVVGIVALNAMVVNTTYRMEAAQQALGDLQAQQGSLSTEVARLSAPSRISEWAHAQQMVTPEDVVILRVAGVGGTP